MIEDSDRGRPSGVCPEVVSEVVEECVYPGTIAVTCDNNDVSGEMNGHISAANWYFQKLRNLSLEFKVLRTIFGVKPRVSCIKRTKK